MREKRRVRRGDDPESLAGRDLRWHTRAMTGQDQFRDAAIGWAVRNDEDARAAMERLAQPRAIILVEGVSDVVAVDIAARRLGREGVCVIPMGGVTNVRRFASALHPFGLPISGLCDVGERRYFERALSEFSVCVQDLEDEFIRALGTERTEQLLDDNGDLATFRTFQNQPAQRGRPVEAQLRRFFGTTAGRKERYATIFMERLEGIPKPLVEVVTGE